jgi:hypothetical protein
MIGTSNRWLRAAVVAFVLVGVTGAGCSAIRKSEAQSEENLLAAAGFKAKPADTPEKLAQLKAMPALKMQMRTQDGKVAYTYADPYNCKCLYVGGPDQYVEYKRLAMKQQIAMDQVEAAEAEEDAAMDWGMWGGFGPWY